jgi:hypothetical protein
MSNVGIRFDDDEKYQSQFKAILQDILTLGFAAFLAPPFGGLPRPFLGALLASSLPSSAGRLAAAAAGFFSAAGSSFFALPRPPFFSAAAGAVGTSSSPEDILIKKYAI